VIKPIFLSTGIRKFPRKIIIEYHDRSMGLVLCFQVLCFKVGSWLVFNGTLRQFQHNSAMSCNRKSRNLLKILMTSSHPLSHNAY